MTGAPTTTAPGPVLGTLTRLWRYPVKSMAAESLESVEVGFAGIVGDRRWAYVRADTQAHGFPWHTNRELGTMSHYVARLTEPGRADHSPVEVTTPGGRVLDVADPELATELGTGVRVFRQNRGIFDDSPLSVISTSTVATLCGLAGAPADPQRFRPNLLVTPTADAPYVEDDWIGRQLRIGAVVIRLDQRDQRCVMVDVNPVTGVRDAPLLKTIGRERRACAGAYGTVVTPGTVRVGDPIQLL